MKIKIACLIPSLQPGGMERVMSELINYFVTKVNVEVHLVMFGLKREVFYELPSQVIIHTPSFEFDNKRRFKNTFRTMYFIRNVIKNIHPTTILSYGELWNNLVLLSLLRTQYPIFVSDRCQPSKSLGRVHDFLRKKLYPQASGIISQTSQAKLVALKNYNNSNIKVIGNPIPNAEKFISKRENIVLTVGRLIQSKHHDELIKLFAGLNQKDWKLIIVGGDALNQQNFVKLQKLIKTLNSEDKIELVGNQKDVASFYKKSKLFAFTSSSEGFPNVIGEALSFGLPVVAFDCDAGPADMIEDGVNGYLVKLFDYQDFSNKLLKLIKDDNLRECMSTNAPQINTKFNKEAIASKYYEFITNGI